MTNFIRQPHDLEMGKLIAKALQGGSGKDTKKWDRILSNKGPKRRKGSGGFGA